MYAELSVKINKEKLDEITALQKWQQVIKAYQHRDVDVNDCSNLKSEKIHVDEVWFVLRSGERTHIPNYKEIYALLGEFIQFLYEEMSYVGPLNISLERKYLVFEIQTQIP